MEKNIDVSVVVPVYGSQKMLPELHARLSAVLLNLKVSYEIIFVEDCGPGNSWQVLQKIAEKDFHVTAIQLMKNSGQANATLCGLANTRGEMIITLDDDLQHPPEEIPKLIAAFTSDVDLVMGVPEKTRHNGFRRFGSHVLHKMNAWFLNRSQNLFFTSFRVIRRATVDHALKTKTLNPAIGNLLSSVTQRIVNVKINHNARLVGRTGYSFSKLLSLTVSNLIGYSTFPLRLLGVIGAVGIIFSLLMSIIFLIRYLSGGVTVPGWMSTILILLFVSGFNFFAFAIFGEYLIRIFQRVNCTPQYLVRDKISSENFLQNNGGRSL